MRQSVASLVAVAALSSCGMDGPPTLPGASDPSCALAMPHHYLITSLATNDSDSVDLSVPPDGRADNLAYPDTYVEAAVGTALADAVGRAFANDHVAWVISTQSCNDRPDYIRVALRRAESVSPGAPLAVATLAPDVSVWSVGTAATGAISVSDGIGVVPVAAVIDLNADSTDAAWFPFYSVVIHATVAATRLSGTIAGAIDTTDAAPAIADALARTLTAAHQAEPACPPNCQHPALADLIRLVDTNGDLQFTGDEILASGGLVELGYFPDLDLLALDRDETVFWPDHDHRSDSLGHGYVFEASEIDVR